MRHATSFTYRYHSVVPVPPVLAFMQREGKLSDRDAYGTFNMGAGFAIFTQAGSGESICATAASVGLSAIVGGTVETGDRRVILEPLDIEYSSDELDLR